MVKNKEPEQSNHNSSQKHPYVKYRIFADDAKDVGVGIAVKRATDVFIEKHGYEGNAMLQEKTSNRFSIILQIFKGGNPDLMINALSEHIANSGRLPTNKNYHPTINIEPIPCDEGVQIVQEPADYIGVQKEREGYLQTIREKEDEAASLTRLLGARQLVMDSQSLRIKTLEDALKCTSETDYKDPFDLLANAYLPRSVDDLIDASDDWETLLKSGNQTLFISLAQEGEINYLTYLDKKYGLKFKSKEEFEKWREKMSSFKLWQETPEAKGLTGSIAKIDADVKLYEIAKSSGASEETLKFLEQIVESNKPKFSELINSKESSSKDFEASRKAYELIASENPEEAYQQLIAVVGRSNERLRKKSELPVIATTKPETEPVVLRFYLPTFDSDSQLEKYVHSLIGTSIVPQGAYSISQSEYQSSEQIRILDANPTEAKKRLSLDYSKMMQDLVLNKLGLKPKIKLLTVKELS